MKNLFLLVLLAAGIWYVFSREDAPPPAPVAAPVVAPRVDYSRVRTFYSPLNDPPVSASGHGSTGSSGSR